MDAKLFEEFVENLIRIVDKMEAFVYIFATQSRAAFQRIRTGLNNIVECVGRSDVKLVRQILNDYISGYTSSYVTTAEQTGRFMANVFAMLPIYIENPDSKDVNEVWRGSSSCWTLL